MVGNVWSRMKNHELDGHSIVISSWTRMEGMGQRGTVRYKKRCWRLSRFHLEPCVRDRHHNSVSVNYKDKETTGDPRMGGHCSIPTCRMCQDQRNTEQSAALSLSEVSFVIHVWNVSV